MYQVCHSGYDFRNESKFSQSATGFVDGHTHPIWAGDRVHEFAMKLAGATVNYPVIIIKISDLTACCR